MLGSFMEEMEITPEQYELACMEGRQNQDDNPFSLHQGLFQQVLKLIGIENDFITVKFNLNRFGPLMI